MLSGRQNFGFLTQLSSATVTITSFRTSRATVHLTQPTRLACRSMRSESVPLQAKVAPFLRSICWCKRRLERRTRSSRGKCRPEHGQAANGRFLCRFVLDDVPVLGQLAVLEAHDIHHDPVRRQAHACEPAVEQHVVSVGDGKPVLVMEAVGCALDQREEALASRRNVRAVLNVVRRPETLRSGIVPFVEKRFESLQHEGLILLLDCPRHFTLLLHSFRPPTCGGSYRSDPQMTIMITIVICANCRGMSRSNFFLHRRDAGFYGPTH